MSMLMLRQGIRMAASRVAPPSRSISGRQSLLGLQNKRHYRRPVRKRGSCGRGQNESKSGRDKATLAAEAAPEASSPPPQGISVKVLWETAEVALRKPRTIPIPRWITPRHYQFTLSECFGHISFVLVAASYAMDDFLSLRIIAVAGSTAMLVFTFFHPHGRVLWLPFKWNLLFIAINSYRIGKVYTNRYFAERLPEEFMDLRQRNFYLMDPVDFYRLARLGTVQEYKKGDLIVAQGELVHCVRFVLEGQCRVLRDGKLTYMLEEANFMSEAGIHAGLLLPGKVESCCSIVADAERTRLLCWERDELIHLLQLHSGVRRSLKAVLSWDAIRKLKAQRSLLAERVIDDPEEWTERRTRQTQHRYAAILHAILSHPGYLEKGRKELNKYRMIHHIDDENHERALADCGWTLEEFEAGRRQRTKKRSVVARGTGKMVWLANEDDDDGEEDDHEVHDAIHRDVKWYLHDIYLRLFG